MHICSSVTFFSSRNGSDYVDEENVITVFVVAQFSGNVFEQLQVKHVGTLVYLVAEGVLRPSSIMFIIDKSSRMVDIYGRIFLVWVLLFFLIEGWTLS